MRPIHRLSPHVLNRIRRRFLLFAPNLDVIPSSSSLRFLSFFLRIRTSSLLCFPRISSSSFPRCWSALFKNFGAHYCHHPSLPFSSSFGMFSLRTNPFEHQDISSYTHSLSTVHTNNGRQNRLYIEVLHLESQREQDGPVLLLDVDAGRRRILSISLHSAYSLSDCL